MRCAAQLNRAAAEPEEKAIHEAVTEAFRQCPARLQTGLAEALVNEASGRDLLLSLIEKGIAPARLLLNEPLQNRLLTTAKSAEDKKSLEQKHQPPDCLAARRQ